LSPAVQTTALEGWPRMTFAVAVSFEPEVAMSRAPMKV
jgi:hypothetical protein